MMSRFSALKVAADFAGLAGLRAFGAVEKYVIGGLSELPIVTAIIIDIDIDNEGQGSS
jgi:hypothetical protein